MIWVLLQSESSWQRNDAITLFIYFCVSLYQEFYSGLIALKTAYKKRGDCSERSRVRRILLTCIQLLLLKFLDVIWSMPTNFAFFKKPLDKFFYKFDNLEINY